MSLVYSLIEQVDTCHICAAELLILQSAMLFCGLTLPVFTEMYDLRTSYLCIMILIFFMLFTFATLHHRHRNVFISHSLAILHWTAERYG